MFKIKSIEISGFWNTKEIFSEFKSDINIIIGKNGTGKTTFMNIVHSVLSVDIDTLYENPFDKVKLTMSNGKSTRTVQVKRIEADKYPFPVVEYKISNRTFTLPLVSPDDRSSPFSARRRASEESIHIRAELMELAAIASLSVYRVGSEPDPEVRDRMAVKRQLSTVDSRLSSLMQKLTQYQLELSNAARNISTQLQKDVLTSLLYTEEKTRTDKVYSKTFDEVTERQNLTTAYKQLGVSGSDISKKIQEHVSAISKAIVNLKSPKLHERDFQRDIAALDAFKLTSSVVSQSLEAEKKVKEIFNPLDLFIKILKLFIEDKDFKFNSGELIVEAEGSIPIAKLSSGEKQLLILFIEALLQRQRPYIFMADEPELSLHIAWQRNIISAIRQINPHAQIIVATHSPEVAGKFRDYIINMGSIIRA